MRTKPLFRRLISAIPQEGERRLSRDGVSLLLTRHDTPYTIVSALVKSQGHCGWVTLESDAGTIVAHHPRNVDLVEQVLETLVPATIAAAPTHA